jgi:hypothetical protein
MPALPIEFDPYNPIPNNPFYSPLSYFLQGPTGPLVVGSGLSVSATGTISASGGGGGGTVTAVTAGTGLAGGTITSTGTLSIANTGVVAGAYTYPALSVNAQGQITSISSGNPVTSVGVNSPLLITGTPTSPTISIQLASTTQYGATQLNNSTSSTLTNQALTAAAGKSLQDQINAVAQNANGLILAGTLNASTGLVVTATTAGNSAGFTAGAVVPAATPAINDYYLIVTTAAASYTPTGGSAITGVLVGDYILVSSGVWTILRVGPITGAYATTTTDGVVQLATSAEVITGTDPNLVVTPFTGTAAYVARKCFTGPGQILASNGVSTYAALGSGIDGQVLTADSSAPLGIKWAPGGGGGGGTISMSFSAPLSATANPYTGGVVGISVDAASTSVCGAVQLADLATTQAGTSPTLALTPLYTAQTYIPRACFTTKGQVLIGTGATPSACALTVGADGLALVACAACTLGVTWSSPLVTATPSTFGAVKGYAAGAGSNLSVGCNSLQALTTGVANTALGNLAAQALASGNGNVAIGSGALALEVAGGCNIAIGVCSLYNSNGGNVNTAVGGLAGCAITTGDNNVLVGSCAGNNLTTQCNQIVIGTNANSCTSGTANGGVTFGFGGGCSIYAAAQAAGAAAWTSVSDARLKEDVADLALGLHFVNQLQPRTYNWKADKVKAAGFIAQEAHEVVENNDAAYLGFVDTSNEYMGVAPATLIPVLVKAIQELSAEVTELKAKLG